VHISTENNSSNGLFERFLPRRKANFALRMAPMIDMTFLLLIFFLVASKWRPAEDFLPLKLTTAGAQTQNYVKPEPLIIRIAADESVCSVDIGQVHTVRIDEADIEKSLAEMIEQTQDVLARQKRFTSDPVELICGPNVRWEDVARIYNLLYGMGITDITFQMTENTRDETFN